MVLLYKKNQGCDWEYEIPDDKIIAVMPNDVSSVRVLYIDDYSIKERETKISIGKDDKSGQIDIVITELSDDVLKRDNDFIIQEANEEFENNNKNYFVNYYGSYKVKDYVVKDFLYTNENAGKQIDFNYIIHNKKLILISYINEDEYFDLYEYKVLDIINSLKIS